MVRTRVTPLSTSELDEALVIASLGLRGLDAGAWRETTVDLMRDPARGGVLIARNEADRACGLLHFRIVTNETRDPSLEVERLVAFDLMHPREVADAMVAEAIRLARLQDCDSFRLIRPLDPPAGATALVLASGVVDLHSVF